MDFYFTDRRSNLLGIASTSSEASLIFTSEEDRESVKQAARTLEGVILFDEGNSKKVKKMGALGNYVLYEDEQGNAVFTTIMEMDHNPATGEHFIRAEDAGMDLINGLLGAYKAPKAMTFAEYFKVFAGNTGFELGINEISNLSRRLEWESDEQTILARLLSAANQFDNSEIYFTFAVNGTQAVKRFLNIRKKRGANKRVTLYVGKDVNNIRVTGGIYDLCTEIDGRGGEIDGKQVTLKGYNWSDPSGRFVLDKVTGRVKDTESVKIWSRLLSNFNASPTTGHITRVKNYETTDKKTLIDNVVRNLEQDSQPAINYETDIANLPENVQIGDTIYLSDEKEELFLSARVLELVRSYSEGVNKAILGDYLIEDAGLSSTLLALAERLKAETTFLWIMYADDEDGNGISPSPAGKDYIAIKPVVGVSTPSENPEDYAGLWRLYTGKDGDQGVPGPQGPGGKTTYTWIKYADDAQGTGISDDPTGKWYIGVAPNKEVQQKSNNPKDYTWSLIKGEDGQDAHVYTAYAWSADGKDRFTPTYPNENLLQGTGIPLVLENSNSNTSKDSPFTKLVPFGEYPGGVLKSSVFVKVKNARTRTGGGTTRVGWEIPARTTDGKMMYIGVWKILTLGENFEGYLSANINLPANIKEAAAVGGMCIQANGDYLEVGKAKLELGDKATIYTPSPQDDFFNAWPTFIGTYTTFEPVQSLKPEDYTWARMLGKEGEDGEDGGPGPQGAQGAPGAQGPTGPQGTGIKTTTVTYAASTSGVTPPASGWVATPPTVAANSFLWTRVQLTYTSSEVVTSYSVGKMGAQGPQGGQGAPGAQGPTGNGIKTTAVTYAASTSGTAAPGTGWVTSPPAVAANSFLWTRVIITYTDNTSTTSYSVGKMGAQGPQGAQGVQGPQGPTGPTGPTGPQGINGIAYLQPTQPTTTQEGAQWFKTVSATNNTVAEIYTRKGGQWVKTPLAQGSLSVSNLAAISANLGTITAGNIRGVEITGSKFISPFQRRIVPNDNTVRKGDITLEDGALTIKYDQFRESAPGSILAKGTQRLDENGFSLNYLNPNGTLISSASYTNAGIVLNNTTYSNSFGVGSIGYMDMINIPMRSLTASSGWTIYATGGASSPRAIRQGRFVSLYGAFKPNSTLPSGLNSQHVMGVLPLGFRPSEVVSVIAQGSGVRRFQLTVQPNGDIIGSRNLDNNGYTPFNAGGYFSISCVFAAADF